MASEIKETVFEFTDADGQACITSSMRKWVNRVKKFAKKYPDKIEIVAENKDGSICAHCPVEWITFSPPRVGRTMSEEQKQAAAERLRKYHREKAEEDNEESDDI